MREDFEQMRREKGKEPVVKKKPRMKQCVRWKNLEVEWESNDSILNHVEQETRLPRLSCDVNKDFSIKEQILAIQANE